MFVAPPVNGIWSSWVRKSHLFPTRVIGISIFASVENPTKPTYKCETLATITKLFTGVTRCLSPRGRWTAMLTFTQDTPTSRAYSVGWNMDQPWSVCAGFSIENQLEHNECESDSLYSLVKSWWLSKLEMCCYHLRARHSWHLMASVMRFLWLLVTQFLGHIYQWQFERNRPC